MDKVSSLSEYFQYIYILIIINDFCLVNESLFLKNWYTNIV